MRVKFSSTKISSCTIKKKKYVAAQTQFTLNRAAVAKQSELITRHTDPQGVEKAKGPQSPATKTTGTKE